MDFKSQSRARIGIAGGGIAGLACAYALLRRGAQVDVFDSGEAGRGALWASGGMLAGGFECCESGQGQAFADLARLGMQLWDKWSAALGRETIGFRKAGVLSPAAQGSERDWLDAMARHGASLGIRTEWCRGLPGAISGKWGLQFPDDGELDNRLLGPRLADAVRDAGGRIASHSPVSSISDASDGGVVLETVSGAHVFDHIILATGVDSGGLEAVEPALSALRPVKGQMVSVKTDHVRLDGCVRARDVYLSQKSDGRIVIGATSETGFADMGTDEDSIRALLDKASRRVPALAQAKETERWAGLRPGSVDGLPIIGSGQVEGVFLALGLYRNGVLLAPAIGEMLADIILEGRDVPFAMSPDRFQQR